MKHTIVSLALLALFLAWGSPSSAVFTQSNSGLFIYSYSENDNDNGLSVSDFESDFYAATDYDSIADIDWDWDTFAFYDKVDAPNTSSPSSRLNLNNLEGKSNEPEEWISGSATTDDPVDFFSVKAGNDFALYWLNPASTSFTWNTSDISGNAAMSHISTWTVSGSSAPVPEAGTLLLFGLGLLGLTGIARKKITAKKTGMKLDFSCSACPGLRSGVTPE